LYYQENKAVFSFILFIHTSSIWILNPALHTPAHLATALGAPKVFGFRGGVAILVFTILLVAGSGVLGHSSPRLLALALELFGALATEEKMHAGQEQDTLQPLAALLAQHQLLELERLLGERLDVALHLCQMPL